MLAKTRETSDSEANPRHACRVRSFPWNLALGVSPLASGGRAYSKAIRPPISSFVARAIESKNRALPVTYDALERPRKLHLRVIRPRLLRLRFWFASALLVLLGLAPSDPAHGQGLSRAAVQQRADQASQLFNWYYAAVYGTGAYKIGEETVGVVRLPMAYTIREMTDEQWGWKLTFPVSAALAQFDLNDFDLGHANVTGLSILPGIEAQIPLKPEWVLKPFANLGGGWEFQRDTSATIWSLGASTLYELDPAPKWPLGLGLKVTYAGYSSKGTQSTLGAVSYGADLGLPLETEFFGHRGFFGAQIVATTYFNKLDFLFPGSPEDEVSNEVELALTFRVYKPIELLGVSFDRIGLGYRQGSDGLKGVRLVASFPF